MAVRKTYEVAGTNVMLTRYMTFMVKTLQGLVVPRDVVLKGHLRSRRKGQYTTSEPALIEAIDERIRLAGSKTTIICVSEEEIPDSQMDATPAVVETKDGEVRFETDVVPTNVKKVIKSKEVAGISKVVDAADWLRENIEGITARDVTNRDKVLKLAEKHNIVFTNLQVTASTAQN